VAAGEAARRFTPNSAPVVTRGFTGSVFWFRFTLVQPPSRPVSAPGAPDSWLLDVGRPIYFFDLQLYIPRDPAAQGGGSAWRVLEINHDLAPKPDYVYRDALILALPGPPGSAQTLYLRAQTSSSMFVPLTLFTHRTHLAQSSTRNLFFGLFYGVMLALLFYNLVLFVSLRDRAHLYYVIFVGCITLFSLGTNGLTFDYLFPANPTIARRVTLAALALTMLFLIQFSRSFLATRENSPWLDRLLLLCMAASAVMLASLPFASFSFLSSYASRLSKVMLPTVIIAGVVCWRRGFRPARTFLVASLVFAAGGMCFSMTYSGQLPYNVLTFYGYQTGSAIQAVLLSLALAERIRDMTAERAALRASRARFQAMAITDPLTRAFNRRYYDTQISLELTRARQLELPLALLVIDLDSFKAFNDSYGHQAGDALLTQVAQLLRACTRDTDSICRYGGEEFAVILPGTDAARAEQIAERIRRRQESQIFRPRRGLAARATLSVGVAQLLPGDEGPDELFARADQALYEAKARGRNRTVVATAEDGAG
jgi:diguanylate cyclase (GGDEF)-like protein